MLARQKTCLTFALTLAASTVWSQSDQRMEEPPRSEQKFIIGALSGLKRPDGFIVDDLRADAMKTSSRKQTYRREFNPFRFYRGPLAMYESNVGDADLNISPVDLLVEKMIARYGDNLKGKRLVVRGFSLTIKESVDKHQGIVAIPGDTASIGIAILVTVAGTAMIRAHGPGSSLSLEVKIEAELDGKPFQGSDYGSIIAKAVDERPANIINGALEFAFYKFDRKSDTDPKTAAPDLVADALPNQ
jgi:hypothetical protein